MEPRDGKFVRYADSQALDGRRNVIGWMFLLERAYCHLISYMREHEWRDYDGRSIGRYRFMLWNIRLVLMVFPLAIAVLILLLI